MADAVDGSEVLVVDDDRDIREVLAEVLQDEGYSVALAVNGADALRYLRSGGSPRVILLDLMMPIMDGWRFRSEQLQDPALGRIPVIVLTADGGAKEKAATLKATEGITKPVRLDALLSAVARVC